jgi:hypothetical protein
MVLSNYEQLLTGCSIVAWANVAHAVVADIEAFDNTEAERTGTLDNATTHIRHRGLGQRSWLMLEMVGQDKVCRWHRSECPKVLNKKHHATNLYAGVASALQ